MGRDTETKMIELKRRSYEEILARMAQIEAKLESAFPSERFETAMAKLPGGVNAMYQPVDPMSISADLSPIAPEAIKRAIQQAAEKAGIDPDLFDALVARESAYNPRARSSVGALGLTQLMPATAKELGVSDRNDPIQSLRGGATYLKQMLERYGGDMRLALAAYNAGPGAVDKHNGVPPFKETQKYVRDIMSVYEARKQP